MMLMKQYGERIIKMACERSAKFCQGLDRICLLFSSLKYSFGLGLSKYLWLTVDGSLIH